MYIKHLELHNFRNYSELSFYPSQGLNILIGKNAQGKTSLLEAIYISALARSWKTGRDNELIKWDAEQSRVAVEVGREEQNDINIEIILKLSEKKQVLINTIKQTKLADVVGQVNVLLIEPHDVDIVRGEPSLRRKFMNLEISQVQPMYCHLLANFRRILDQRNRLLKDIQAQNLSSIKLLEVINEQFVSFASSIISRRIAFINRIAELAKDIHREISGNAEILDIQYVSKIRNDGLAGGKDIEEALRQKIHQARENEFRRGVTLIGPQRDDMIIKINGIDARVYGSQGQQRTVALSLRLAEMSLMRETAKEPPVVLLDDVMSDLDEERRNKVFNLTKEKCQTFITSASKRIIEQNFLDEAKVYTISEGKVMPQ